MRSQDDRIAVVSHSHPSLTKGGAEISAYSLFKGLQTIGLDPVFIAACPVGKRASLYLDDRDEHAVFYDESQYSHFYHLADPLFADRLTEIAQSTGCSILSFQHFLHIGLNSLSRLSAEGFRCFLTLHEYLAICNHYGQMVTRGDMQLCDRASPSRCHRCYPEAAPQQFLARRQVFGESFEGAEHFISPSHFLKRRFVEWGLPEDKISVVENGLDRDIAGLSMTARDPSVPWTFGYFGQINPFKGVDVLIRAAELLAQDSTSPPVRIRVHGNMVGQSEEFLGRFRQACAGTTVDYHGPYDNGEVMSLMQACDYVVVPSLWWENSPVVIQEAFAAGRPVIATGVGGLAEKVLDGRTGLHFRLGSAPDLKRALVQAADPTLHESLRTNLTQPMDSAAMARAYLAVFAGSDQRLPA